MRTRTEIMTIVTITTHNAIVTCLDAHEVVWLFTS